MSFATQSKRAKSLTRGYRANYKFNKEIGRTPDLFGNAYYDWQLKKGFDAAYSSPEGYSVMRNPISDEPEMFVRGTKTGGEWLQNAAEALPRWAGAAVPVAGLASNASRRWRKSYAKKLDYAQKRSGSKVVYGHSRGAAVVGDMTSSFKKVGVDGAMLLSKDKKFTNYRQDQPFDWFISRGEKNSVVRRGTSWKPWKRGFHKAYVH